LSTGLMGLILLPLKSNTFLMPWRCFNSEQVYPLTPSLSPAGRREGRREGDLN
jgi:hypothetical protein